MLQLPIISGSIPVSLVSRESRHRGAMFARHLLDAGMVRDEHVPQRFDGNYLSVVRKALHGWAEGQLGGLRMFRTKFVVHVGQQDISASSGGEQASKVGAAVTGFCHGGDFDVGRELERLEALRPRLGQTVLHTIERLAWKVAPLCGPKTILELARDCYWGGEDDETEYLTNFDDVEERSAVQNDMVTRKLFDDTFPKWTLDWKKGQELSTTVLRRCMSDLKDRRALGVIADLIALRTAKLPNIDWRDREGYFLGFAGVLSWGASDALSVRVCDDYMNQLGESGEYFEDCLRLSMDFAQPRSVHDCFEQLERWCGAVRIIDSLIARLAARK